MLPNPKHLILNLLLAAEGEPLTASDAVGACALFGLRENSVRVALVRLASVGMIEAAGRGSYRLGPQAAGLAGDLASWRGSEKRVRPWKGDWIAVHLGGLRRSDRVAQRARDRALALLGLRELTEGLFIRPDNLASGVAGVRERLHKLGLDAHAPVFIAQQFDEASEQQARKLWDGKALTKIYRETRRKLDNWLARADQLEPEVAARESYLVGHEAIRRLVFDPLLPEPLVDVDERRAFVDTVVKFDRAGHAIWQGLQSFPSPASRSAGALRRTH
ncbi:MAG: PaaX family transcriptional regulator C-terminal domain-containing protein [Stenotrophobium sp.]